MRAPRGGGLAGIAADKKADKCSVHALPPGKVGGVLGRTCVGFHQKAGNAHLRAVAMGQARVAAWAIRERLHRVALGGQCLYGLLLQGKLGLAQRRQGRAADFQTVGIVLVAAVPVVGIHDEGRAQRAEQAGHRAGFGLGERPPIAVQIGRNGVLARAGFGSVRIDHWHDIQSDRAQVGAQSRVLPIGDLCNQPEKRLGRRRLIPMLAAEHKQALGLRGRRLRVAQPHQPQRTALHRLPRRRQRHPGRTRSVALQRSSHGPVRRDRAGGGLRREGAQVWQQKQKQRCTRAHN